MTYAKNIAISVLSGAISSILFISLHSYYYRSSIGTIEMSDILQSHLRKYGAKELSEEEKKKSIDNFSSILQQTIHRISEKENVTLLVRKAVVSGTSDYTSYIKKELKEYVDER